MGIESEELVELNDRLETQIAIGTVNVTATTGAMAHVGVVQANVAVGEAH